MDKPGRLKLDLNLARLPLFSLTRGSGPKIVSVKAEGSYEVEGSRIAWSVEVSPNAKTGFPGPLSRSVHLGLISLATEHGGRLHNPISWRWCDLLDRIGLSYSGQAVEDCKRAIRAIHGLAIWSCSAIYDAGRKRPIDSKEEAAHLFERLTFLRRGTEDKNGVWLSEWYLDNLNLLHTLPLDLDLWLRLDSRSQIASRLYEYLSYGRAHDTLSIQYPTLADYLPVVRHPHLSLARQQLDQAMDLCCAEGVLSDVHWEPRSDCVALVRLSRGAALRGHDSPITVPTVQPAEPTRVTIETVPPAETLAALWHELMHTTLSSRKDITIAASLIGEHGQQRATRLIQRLYELTNKNWKNCGSLSGAWVKYGAEVVAALQAQEATAKATATATAARHRESEAQRQQHERERCFTNFLLAVSCPEWVAEVESIVRKTSSFLGPNMLRRMVAQKLQEAGDLVVYTSPSGSRTTVARVTADSLDQPFAGFHIQDSV